MEEIVVDFSRLISNGSANYCGTAEWTISKLDEVCQIAERLGLNELYVKQCYLFL